MRKLCLPGVPAFTTWFVADVFGVDAGRQVSQRIVCIEAIPSREGRFTVNPGLVGRSRVVSVEVIGEARGKFA